MSALCHASRRASCFPCVSLLAACLFAVPGCSRGADSRSHAPQAAPSTAAAAPAKAQPPTVIFLGDSISAGLHLPAEEAFPAVLERTFAHRGLPFRLINAGVSGDTTSGGLRRTDWILAQKPTLVVLELGANDGLRGLDLKLVEENLRAIIAKVRAQGSAVLLLGMRLPTSHGPAYTEAFADLYTRIAADLKVPFVPFFMHGVAGVAELNLEDGLHPTAQGHELLAKNVADALEPLLRDAAVRNAR